VNQKSTKLEQLMQQVGISSFRQLSDRTQISRRGIDLVRQQQAQNLKYADLLRLSQVLQISLDRLIQIFGSPENVADAVILDFHKQDSLKPECDRLPIQLLEIQLSEIELSEIELGEIELAKQQKRIKTELINETLQKLESLLLQLPTAIYAAKQNPGLPARNLLPLLRPFDLLLQCWNIEVIGEVGSIINFDPQWHSLIDEREDGSEPVESGESVIVRYVGYKQIEDRQERLIYRAKVSSATSFP
jgi:transcriptional regulator with XRE-family HTH domain